MLHLTAIVIRIIIQIEGEKETDIRKKEYTPCAACKCDE